mgnify:CR=1 FL=1
MSRSRTGAVRPWPRPCTPGGAGIRLDGGTAYAGAVITPYYDSLLVKVCSSALTYEDACLKMDRALAEWRIRGVRTNIAHRQRGLWGVLNRLAFLTQRSPRKGGDVLVWLAASPDVVGRAGFYKDRRAIPCQWRDDIDGQERLWALCQRQLAAS